MEGIFRCVFVVATRSFGVHLTVETHRKNSTIFKAKSTNALRENTWETNVKFIPLAPISVKAFECDNWDYWQQS